MPAELILRPSSNHIAGPNRRGQAALGQEEEDWLTTAAAAARTAPGVRALARGSTLIPVPWKAELAPGKTCWGPGIPTSTTRAHNNNNSCNHSNTSNISSRSSTSSIRDTRSSNHSSSN